MKRALQPAYDFFLKLLDLTHSELLDTAGHLSFASEEEAESYIHDYIDTNVPIGQVESFIAGFDKANEIYDKRMDTFGGWLLSEGYPPKIITEFSKYRGGYYDDEIFR